MKAILEGVEGWASIPHRVYKVILRPIFLSVWEFNILAILNYRLLSFLNPGFYLLSRGKELRGLVLPMKQKFGEYWAGISKQKWKPAN